MPRFRCAQCKGEFVAAKPACEKCGLDPEKDARHAAFFLDLVTIHFDPPTHVPGLGNGHAACNPTLRTGSNGDAWTGEKQVVNCEACKASDEFKSDGPPAAPNASILFNKTDGPPPDLSGQ